MGLPSEIQKNLKMQENSLLLQKKDDKYSFSLEKYLSKKLKKDNKDLLLNKSDSHRLKKELFDSFESNQTPFEKYKNNHWYI